MANRKGPLTAREFFALKLDGASMTDAQLGTALGYTTIRELAARTEPGGGNVAPPRALEEWSKRVKSAKAAGVWISAARTLGLA